MHTVVQRFWKFLPFSSCEQNDYYKMAPVNIHSQISGWSLHFESGGSNDQYNTGITVYIYALPGTSCT